MNKLMSRVGAATLALVMTATSMPMTNYAAFSQYTDINNHWARHIIEDCTKTGIAHGYPDNTFKPDNSISRAEFATWVNNLFHYKSNTNVQNGASFGDTKNHWASQIIEIAVSNGIIVPSEYGIRFNPDQAITRMEMVKMMVRAVNLESQVNSHSNQAVAFKDGYEVTNSTDKGFLNVANDYNIISGYTDGTFKPYSNATRAEGAAMLLRLDDYAKGVKHENNQFEESSSGWDQYAEDQTSNSSSGTAEGSNNSDSGRQHRHEWLKQWVSDGIKPLDDDYNGIEKGFGWHECNSRECTIHDDYFKYGYHRHKWEYDYNKGSWFCHYCDIDGGKALPRHEHSWSEKWEMDKDKPADGDKDGVEKGHGWHPCLHPKCTIDNVKDNVGYHLHKWRFQDERWKCEICQQDGGQAKPFHIHSWSDSWHSDNVVPEQGDPNGIEKGYGWNECVSPLCGIDNNKDKRGFHKHQWKYDYKVNAWSCLICGKYGGTATPKHEHDWSSTWVTDGVVPSNNDTNPVQKGYGWHECQHEGCNILSNASKDGYHKHNWEYDGKSWQCTKCGIQGGSAFPSHEHNWSHEWMTDGVVPLPNDKNGVKKGHGWHECTSEYCFIVDDTKKNGYHTHEWNFDGDTWTCKICHLEGGVAIPHHVHKWGQNWTTDKIFPQEGDAEGVRKGHGWHECTEQFCNIHVNSGKDGYHVHSWHWTGKHWICTECNVEGGKAEPRHEHRWSSDWTTDGEVPNSQDYDGVRKGYGWHECVTPNCTITSNREKEGYHKHTWSYDGHTWNCIICDTNGGSARPNHRHDWASAWTNDGIRPIEGDSDGVRKGYGWHECTNEFCPINSNENKEGYHEHIWSFSHNEWRCVICNMHGGQEHPYHEHNWSSNWETDNIVPEAGDPDGIKKGYGWHECKNPNCDAVSNNLKHGYHHHQWRYEDEHWSCVICGTYGGNAIPRHKHVWSNIWSNDGKVPKEGDPNHIKVGFGWHECTTPYCDIESHREKGGYHQHSWTYNGQMWTCDICGANGGTVKPEHKHKWSDEWVTDGIQPVEGDKNPCKKGYGWKECLNDFCSITNNQDKEGYHRHVWNFSAGEWECTICHVKGGDDIPMHVHSWSEVWKDDGLRPEQNDPNGIRKGYGWHECNIDHCTATSNREKDGYHQHQWQYNGTAWKCSECGIDGGSAQPFHNHVWSTSWVTDNIIPEENDVSPIKKGHGWHECQSQFCYIEDDEHKDGYHEHNWVFNNVEWVCTICKMPGGSAKPFHEHKWSDDWVNDGIIPEVGDNATVMKGHAWHECLNPFCDIHKDEYKNSYHPHNWQYDGRKWKCTVCGMSGGEAQPQHTHQWSAAWTDDGVRPVEGDPNNVQKGYGWHECESEFCTIPYDNMKQGYHSHVWRYNGADWQCSICKISGGSEKPYHQHDWKLAWETSGEIPIQGDVSPVKRGYGWHECNNPFCTAVTNADKEGYHQHNWVFNNPNWACTICGADGGKAVPSHNHAWSNDWTDDGKRPAPNDPNGIEKGYGWHECESEYCTITDHRQKDGYHKHKWIYDGEDWKCQKCNLYGGTAQAAHTHKWAAEWTTDNIIPQDGDPNRIQKGHGWHECTAELCPIKMHNGKNGYHEHTWIYNGSKWTCEICGADGGTAKPRHIHHWSDYWEDDGERPTTGDTSPVTKGHGWHECESNFCNIQDNTGKSGYHEHNWVYNGVEWVCSICKIHGGSAKPTHEHRWSDAWSTDGIIPVDGDTDGVKKGHGWKECKTPFCDVVENEHKGEYHVHTWRYNDSIWTCEICHEVGGTAKPKHTHKWSQTWTDDGIRPQTGDPTPTLKGYGWHECDDDYCPVIQDSKKQGFHQHEWNYNGNNWECARCHLNGGTAKPYHNHKWSTSWKTNGEVPSRGDPNGIRKGYGWHECTASYCPIINNSDKGEYHQHIWQWNGSRWNCEICKADGGTAAPDPDSIRPGGGGSVGNSRELSPARFALAMGFKPDKNNEGYYGEVKKLVFSDKAYSGADYSNTVDISTRQDMSVILEKKGDSVTVYADGGCYPAQIGQLFNSSYGLIKDYGNPFLIEVMDKICFPIYGCEEIDFRGIDLSGVPEAMYHIYCPGIRIIDISNFNLANSAVYSRGRPQYILLNRSSVLKEIRGLHVLNTLPQDCYFEMSHESQTSSIDILDLTVLDFDRFRQLTFIVEDTAKVDISHVSEKQLDKLHLDNFSDGTLYVKDSKVSEALKKRYPRASIIIGKMPSKAYVQSTSVSEYTPEIHSIEDYNDGITTHSTDEFDITADFRTLMGTQGNNSVYQQSDTSFNGTRTDEPSNIVQYGPPTQVQQAEPILSNVVTFHQEAVSFDMAS